MSGRWIENWGMTGLLMHRLGGSGIREGGIDVDPFFLELFGSLRAEGGFSLSHEPGSPMEVFLPGQQEAEMVGPMVELRLRMTGHRLVQTFKRLEVLLCGLRVD